MTQLKKIVFAFAIISLAQVSQVFSQEKTAETKKVNFGYSANPPAKVSMKIDKNKKSGKVSENAVSMETAKKVSKDNTKIKKDDATKQANIIKDEKTAKTDEVVSIAKKTREVTEKASRAKLLPTEIYKVGVGDVLFINLQDTAAKYYTVLIDGTIDYPLAGKLVSVVDLTTDEIEDLLREKIKIYETPQVTVKIREYASHQIQVEGLARVGKHYLQREAMPLVVVKTMVGVKSDATKVTVERKNSDARVLSLSDSTTDLFLIEKGDKLIFENENSYAGSEAGSSKSGFYRVGKKICSGGTKKIHEGITLVQAIFEVCGELNKKLKEVSIIRKTASGVFITKRYKLKQILNGKQTDPLLLPGDMIDLVK